jgi:hypothetical protein
MVVERTRKADNELVRYGAVVGHTSGFDAFAKTPPSGPSPSVQARAGTGHQRDRRLHVEGVARADGADVADVAQDRADTPTTTLRISAMPCRSIFLAG